MSPPCWATLPPPPPLGCHRASCELPASCSELPLSISHTVNDVSALLSQSAPPAPSPTGSTGLFSRSASPFLSCKQVPQHHFSRFHVYMCVNIQYLFSSFWPSSLCLTGSRFISLKSVPFHGWVTEFLTENKVYLFKEESCQGESIPQWRIYLWINLWVERFC